MSMLYIALDVCSSLYWSNVETVICPAHTSFIFMWKTQLDEFSFPYHVSGDHIRCSSLWVEHNGRRSVSVWNVALVTLMDILAPVDVCVCVCLLSENEHTSDFTAMQTDLRSEVNFTQL